MEVKKKKKISKKKFQKKGNKNLNCAHARQFMRTVLQATVAHINELRGIFFEKIKELKKLPEEVQKKVYSKFHGPIHFDMEVKKKNSRVKKKKKFSGGETIFRDFSLGRTMD
jgi:hypothetical protein